MTGLGQFLAATSAALAVGIGVTVAAGVIIRLVEVLL